MRTCAEIGGVSISQLIRTAIAQSLRDTTQQAASNDVAAVDQRLAELADEVHDLSRVIDHLRLTLLGSDSQPDPNSLEN
jgi:uncharacterized protein YlxW (UPF0749 family)